VNAEESDPGSMIDRFLIEGDPFKLIEGAAIAAYAIGARKILVHLRANHLLAIQRLEKAIEETKRFGFLGHDIFGSGYSLDISLAKGSGAFACGEETALIKSIEGKRGMPETKPPYPSDNGLFKKPTVVNSAETLYSVPDIMARGAGWFKTIGTEKSRGTKMIGLTGKINHQGILEIPMGTSMLDIIEKAGGGTRDNKPLKAVHVGGPSGGSIPPENLLVTYDYEQLSEAGCLMGSGGILVLDDSVCMVNLSKYFMDFIQKESCGKCIPCREGSRRMYEILDNISKRPRTETNHQTLERFKGVIQLESLSEVMKDTSLCGMGQAAPNAVLTALKWFREEFEDHIFDRNCKAGVCKDLRMYYIDVDKCTGCTACARKCPANAIVGTKHQPFFIVQEKCTACGICYETCKFDAISIV
jgi:NADH:ubiquinone oxidoreductase subunit F (NADH-binding)